MDQLIDSSSQKCKGCGATLPVDASCFCPHCGGRLIRRTIESPWPSGRGIRPGDIVDGRYTVVNVSGASNNRFLLAMDDNRRLHVLKVMDDTFQGFTRYECELLVNFDHPFIDDVEEMLYCDKLTIAVMRIRDCSSVITDSMRAHTPLQEDLVIKWGMQLCDALGYLHARGYVHGDLRLSAIAPCEEGSIILASFWKAHSISTKESARATGSGEAASAASLGPERDEIADEIYQLGVLLFELATGRQLHRSIDYASAPLPFDHAEEPISSGLASVLRKATRLDKSGRYRSCGEMHADLEELALKKKSGRFSASRLFRKGSD